MGRIFFVVSVISVSFAWAACNRQVGEAVDGRTLFEQTCGRCHGADGKGEPVAKAQLGVPDMTASAWQQAHSDDDIRNTVRAGSKSKKMPPFGNVYSPAQLDALVEHVRSFRPKP